jgi:hypothetical protein
MRIIGCDLHARQQSVAMLDTEKKALATADLVRETRLPRRCDRFRLARHSPRTLVGLFRGLFFLPSGNWVNVLVFRHTKMEGMLP